MGSEYPGRGDVAVSITELQNLLLATPGVAEFLHEVAVLAAGTVAKGLSCGITLQPDGHPMTVASSDTRANQVDEIQYEIHEGPCLHAMVTGDLVVVTDTIGMERWGGFSARAAANGIRSSLSVPLVADGISGALNLYAPVADSFGDAEIGRAQLFAASASAALALASRQSTAAALTGQLREALASRAVIDQALGIVMAQERCNSRQAFAILRTASQNRNTRLRDIAHQIVTSVSGQAPQPSPFNG
jgi:GAF domain-containing protein